MRLRSRLTQVALAGLVVACGQAGPVPGPSPSPSPSQSRGAASGAEPRRLGAKVFPLAAAPALDDPARDAWQRPTEVIEELGVRPGERVADIGCGTGYFTVRLAWAVGASGHVLALDIQPGMLDILRARLTPELARIVEPRLAEPARPLVSGDRVDLALCANTLHEVDDAEQEEFLASLRDGLKPGGRLALINWLPGATGLGPPLKNRIAPERVRALAEAAGLSLERESALLPTHSFLIYRRP